MKKLLGLLKKLIPKKKSGESEEEKFPGLLMALVGLGSSGKTTLMAALADLCRNSRDLKLEYTNSKTADYFLSSIRRMAGSMRQDGSSGGQSNQRGFPELTSEPARITFTIHIDSAATQISSLDYPGKEIIIGNESETRETITKFFRQANSFLYVIDSDDIKNDSVIDEYQALHSNIFADLKKRKVKFHPSVAIVLTKADQLEGYSTELPSRLFSHIDNSNRFDDYNTFIETVLDKNRSKYSTSVLEFFRSVLLKLRPLIELIHKNTLELNVFFVTSIGGNPEKVIGEDGSDVDIPPEEIHPHGIRELVTWVTRKMRFYRRLYRLKRVLRFAALLCFWFTAVFLGLQLLHKYHYVDNFLAEYSPRTSATVAYRYLGGPMSFTKRAAMAKLFYTNEIRLLMMDLSRSYKPKSESSTDTPGGEVDDSADEEARAKYQEASDESKRIGNLMSEYRAALGEARRNFENPVSIHDKLRELATGARDYYRNTYKLKPINNRANIIEDYLHQYEMFADREYTVDITISPTNADEVGSSLQVVRVYIAVNDELVSDLDEELPVTHTGIKWKPGQKITLDARIRGTSEDTWESESPYFPDLDGQEIEFEKAAGLKARISLRFDPNP